MNKTTFFIPLAILLGLCFFPRPNATAQIGDGMELYYEAQNHIPCDVPIVKTASVIQYRQGAALLLQFDKVPQALNIVSQSGQIIHVSENENYRLDDSGTNFLVKWMPKNQSYHIELQSTCNESVVVKQFDTNTRPFENGIEVSDDLYRNIVQYQKNREDYVNLKISDYIKNANGVHFFEKVFFLQNYLYKRTEYTDFSDTTFPDDPRAPDGPTDGPDSDPDNDPDDPDSDGDCLCDFVLRGQQSIFPGTAAGGVLQDDIFHSGFIEFGRHDRGDLWYTTYNKGACKYEQIWTDACRVGSLEREYSLADQEDDISTDYGRISYNLLCTKEEYLSDCQCEVPIRLLWNYSSRVTAYADTKSCGNSTKRGIAQAHDIGLVYYTENGGDPIFIDGLDTRAAALCERVVNNTFWQNIADVAVQIIGTVLQATDSTGFNPSNITSEQIDNVSQSIQTAIGTPFYSSKTCNSTQTDATTGNRIYNTYLQPNVALDFYVASNSDIMAGGRKSFWSWSRVLTDFYMAAVILSEGESEDCCFDPEVSWIFSGRLGAQGEHEDVRTQLGHSLGSWGDFFPADPYSGVLEVPSDYGRKRIDGECNEDGQLTDETPLYRTNNSETNIVKQPENYDYIRLYDVTGKMIYEVKNVPNISVNLSILFQNHVPASGIYLLEKRMHNDRITEKIFITK